MNKMRLLMMLLFACVCLIGMQGTATQVHASGEEDQHFYIPPNQFKTFGSWTLSGDFLLGRITAPSFEDADGSGGEPAIADVNITEAGNYRLWVRDRDFANNSPGVRTFHVSVDGTMVGETFGDHGQEGFRWSEVGVFNLNAGNHELALHDTSGFYARSEGFFLSNDVSLVPPEDKEELLEIVQPQNPFDSLPSAAYPAWAKEDVAPIKTDSIENDSVKVVFHRGAGAEGMLVQNEIFIKQGNVWVLVKGKTEEFGVLMMKAVHSELGVVDQTYSKVLQRVKVNGVEASRLVDDYFRTGYPIWFIPSDYTVLAANKVELVFPNTEADLKVVFELDSLTDDPKVTLNADFVEGGAYSFLLFSGDGVAYEDYDTVTAPLLYVKKAVPDKPIMIPESFMFTPMATLHFADHQSKVPGHELTSGVVMDPGSVPQGYTIPETSNFGLVLRDQEGNVRPQLIAPMFGTDNSLFEEGDSYEVSFRIINRLSSWYDTLKHVSEKLYNFTDLRTNYFHSINEAIYNATDLMMDDVYGGWDTANMAHYNMEQQGMTTLANSMAALQRYLLTEDEELLDKRAVPTLAYMLSRQHYHFKSTNSPGGANYANYPAPIGGPVSNYTASVYGGLYEMTQGRMPVLLNQAVHNVSGAINLRGITDQAAMYKYTEDDAYLTQVVALADQYLRVVPNYGANREIPYINSFVYGEYYPMVTAFLAAYEATGDPKYLEAAEEGGRLLATEIWTTGYHNDYATTDYVLDPVETAERPIFAERFDFWWHGEQKWRLGNIDGEAKSPQEAGLSLQQETAPGWLPAKAGQGTEHWRTPGHGNIISMNNWAGMMVKLSVYTGDPYFETMARNAMVGRYGNYPGYYQDRYLFHTMKEDYPFTGPDYTTIYWHHIPVFISMLEDFLINSAWAKSERNIEFPSIYQSGYAFFASNQYGHAAGRFYGEDDMWLWLDRGIIDPGTAEIDYIAARKDGVVGLALMNESNNPIASTITLGEKVPGGADYSGTAVVYAADGITYETTVVNGQFSIEIPAKGIRSVVLEIAGVETPGFAKTDYEFSNNPRGTVTEHTRGKGHVIQVAPDSYYAYVYVTDMNDKTSKVTINYQIGSEAYTAEKIGYPYEFLIKVDDPAKGFIYTLKALTTTGQTESLGGGALRPTDFANPAISIQEQGKFDPVHLEVTGTGIHNNMLRFVVRTDDIPFAVTENLFEGLRVTGVLTHRTNGSVKELDSIVSGNEVRSNGTVVLLISPTTEVPYATYSNYDIAITLHPKEDLSSYEPFALPVSSTGTSSGMNRMVVSVEDFPFRVTRNIVQGLRVTGVLTHKTNGSVLLLDSTIQENEMRGSSQTVLVISPTTEVPFSNYKDYDIVLAIHPNGQSGDKIPASAQLSNNQGHSDGLLDGTYDVRMNMWWGNNGNVYRLYENDTLIDTRILEASSPDAQSATTAVANNPNGSYRYYAILANAFGVTRSDDMIVEVTQAAPALPVLSHNNWSAGGDYHVVMNVWWGTNGNEYRLYENDVLIDTQSLTEQSPRPQTALTEIRSRGPGMYVYRAELINDAGTSKSQDIAVEVKN